MLRWFQHRSRAVERAASVVVAAGVAVLINVWTSGWSWPAGIGLAVLIGCQAVFEWSRARAVDRCPVRLQESTTDETSSGVRNSGSQTNWSSLTEAPHRIGQASVATEETDQHIKSLAMTAKGKWVVVGSLLNRASVSSSVPRSSDEGIYRGGHRGAVTACSVSGNRVLTIGDDRVLKVWDVSSGRLIQAMSAPPSVESASIDGYGKCCVVGRALGNLEVFDLEQQFMARAITVDGRPVDDGWKTRRGVQDEKLPAVGFSRFGSTIVRPIVLYYSREFMISAVDKSSQGDLVVTGTTNGVVRVWDERSGILIHELSRDGGFVRAARFMSDGQHVVTVAQMGGLFVTQWLAVEMWSLTTGQVVHDLWSDSASKRFRIDCNDDRAAALSRDGRYLATGSPDGTLILYDLTARRKISCLAFPSPINCLAIDETKLVIGTEGGEVIIADFAAAKKDKKAVRKCDVILWIIYWCARLGGPFKVASYGLVGE